MAEITLQTAEGEAAQQTRLKGVDAKTEGDLKSLSTLALLSSPVREIVRAQIISASKIGACLTPPPHVCVSVTN